MFYKKYPPDPSLQHIVECYFVWEGYSNDIVSIESPPSAFSSMVFNYRRPYSVSTIKYDYLEAPQSFICGQAVKNYTLHLKGEIGMAGIVFKPTGLYSLLGLPMYEFTGERLPVLDFINAAQIEPLIKLGDEETHLIKVQKLEAFVLQLVAKESYGIPQIRYAANEILNSFGTIDLADVLKAIFMSRRQFERRFLDEVGVSPKAYAKIRRFGHACLLMSKDKSENLSDILYTTGYYDQSHFIRDFKYFSGRTPKTYINNNNELAKYVRTNFSYA